MHLKKARQKNKPKFKKGFSLGEVLLSVFILGSVLVTAIALVAGDLRYMINSQNQVIATGLAQEGTELVLNIRDNNIKNGRDAFSSDNSNSNFPNNSGSSVRIDYDDDSLSNYDPSSYRLYLNGNKFYQHNGGTSTKFQRKIIINYYNSSNNSSNRDSAVKAQITSVVIWGSVFPSGTNISKANCNINNKCVFSKIILYKQ